MKSLTFKELQIIQYIAEGCTAKEIARFLGIEPRTVEMYMGAVKKKLSARNTPHAIYIASQRAILPCAAAS